MRSRLPDKLRSSPQLAGAMTVKVPGAVIMKGQTRLAKRGFIMRGFIAQVRHDAEQAPRHDQAKAHKQQHSERDIHDNHRMEFLMRNYKIAGFFRL